MSTTTFIPAGPARRWLAWVAVLVLITVQQVAFPSGANAAIGAPVILNSGGGTGANDGLMVYVGNGQIQVQRRGDNQLYNPAKTPSADPNASTDLFNGFFLSIGSGANNVTLGPYADVSATADPPIHHPWDNVVMSGTVTTGSTQRTTMSMSMNNRTINGINVGGYGVTVTIVYTNPNEFFLMDATVTVPSTNTQPVYFYEAFDGYLGGNDYGYHAYNPSSPESVYILPDPDNPAPNAAVEGIRSADGKKFGSYYGGRYKCMFQAETGCPNSAGSAGGYIQDGRPFPNTVATQSVDSGFGVAYRVVGTGGTPAGGFNVKNDLIFLNQQPTLTIAKSGPAAMTVGIPTSYTVTVKNSGVIQTANVNFNDYLPPNFTFQSATGPAGISCSQSGQDLACSFTEDIPMGGSVDVSINVTPTAAASNVVNHAAVAGDGTTSTIPTRTNCASATPSTQCAKSQAATVSLAADLGVTAGQPTIVAGTSGATVVTVTNGGPNGSTAATQFTYTPPTGVNVTMASLPAGCVNNGDGSVTCTVGALANGASTTVTIPLQVPAGTTAGTKSNGTVLVGDTGSIDPVPANNTAPASVVVVAAAPAIAVIKTATVTDVNGNSRTDLGDRITYTFKVKNTGNMTLTGVRLTDPMLVGVTDASGTVPGGPIASLGPGAENTTAFSFTHTITTTDVSAGQVTNRATATGTPPTGPAVTDLSGQTYTDDNPTVTPVNGIPATLSKSFSPASVSVNGVTTLTFTVTNSSGNLVKPSFSFTDSLPSGLEVAPTPNFARTCANPTDATPTTGAPSAGAKAITASGSLAAGQASCTFSVDVVGTSIGTKSNGAANITSATELTPPTTTATLTVLAPTFTATKAVSKATPIVGEPVTFTVKVSNSGPGAGTATMSDLVPPGVTVTDATCTNTGGSTCTVTRNNNSVSGSVTAPAGGETTFLITGTASTAGALTNQATVSATTPGCTTALCGGATPSVDATIGDKPVFAVAKTADKSSYIVGETVVYTVTVDNTGLGAGTADVGDAVPTAVTVTSVSCTGTNGATCTSANAAGAVTGTVTMPGKSRVTFTITGTAATTGPVTNTATVAATTTGCSPNNQCGGGSASVNSTVGDKPVFSQTKTVSDQTLIVGQPVTYTVVVKNSGAATGSASILDEVPTQISVTGVTCTATTGGVCSTGGSAGNAVKGTVTLPAGGTATFTISGRATAVASGVVNVATVNPITPGCTGTNCGGGSATSPDVKIEPKPFFTQTKTPNANSYAPNTPISYAIVITNTGAAAGTASLTDSIPAAVTLAATDPVTCATSRAGDTCTIALNGNVLTGTVSLSPGESVTYTVTGTVGATTDFVNTVKVTPTTDGCVDQCGGGTATAVTPSGPFFIATKTVPRTSYLVGETITYAVTVTNSGAADGQVEISDPVPTGQTLVGVTCASTTVAPCSPTMTGDTVTGTFTMPKDSTLTLTITARATAAGTGANTATVAGSTFVNGQPEACGTNCGSGTVSSPEVTITAPPYVEQVKSFDHAVPSYLVGQAITYTVTVTNKGSAGEALFSDTVPSNVTVSDVTCAPTTACALTRTGNVIVGSVTLAAGTPAEPTKLEVTITGVVTSAGSLVNTATVTPDTPNCTTALCGGGNATTGPVDAVEAPHFTQSKTVGKTAYLTGETITYTITVTNDGRATGTATITDAIPTTVLNPTTQCVATGAGAGCAAAGPVTGNALNTTVTLPPGGSATLTVTGRATLPSGTPTGSAKNTATIAAPPGCDTVCGGGDASTSEVTVTQAPHFVQTKTADKTAYLVGQAIVYTITVENTGEGLGHTTLRDTVPDPVQVTSVSCDKPATVTCDPQLSGATITDQLVMPGGTRAVITIVGIVVVAGEVGNTVTISPTTPGCVGQCGGGSASTDPITAGTNSLFSQVKTIEKTSYQVGETVTYTLTVTNHGAAGTATVADTIPATVRDVSVTCSTTGPGASCSPTAGTGNALSGVVSLPTNGTATFTITGTAAGVGSVRNTATVTPTTPGCDRVDCGGGSTSTPPSTVVAPHFVGSKTADRAGYLVGQVVTYTITVTNDGDGLGTSRVTDTVPAILTGVAWTCAAPAAGASCGAPSGTGSALDVLVTLPVGAVATITITGTAATAGDARNIASIGYSGTGPTPGCSVAICGGGPFTTDVSAGDETTIPVAVPPDFVASKVMVPVTKVSYQVGEVLTYQITVTNRGGGPGTATIADTIPSTVDGVSVSCSTGGVAGASCSTIGSGANSVAGSVSLPAGGSATFTITGTATSVGSAKNTVSVTPTTPGCGTGTNQVNCGGGSADTPEVTVAAPEFTQTKTAGKSSYLVGETVTYTLKVSNTGAGAGSATITDTVPSTIGKVSVSCPETGGSGVTCRADGNAIVGAVSLPPGGSVIFTITGTAVSAGSATNTATVTATTPGCTTQCGGGDAPTTAVEITPAPHFVGSKTADRAGYLVGQVVTYTITVTNNGTAAGTSRVTDTVPGILTGVAWTCAAPAAGASCGAPSGTGSALDVLVTLPVGAVATITITGTAATAGDARNIASIGYSGTGPTPGCTVAICGGGPFATDVGTTIPVAGAPRFEQAKTADKTGYGVGETVIYTVTITNSGDGAGTATIADTVPATISGVAVTCSTTGVGARCDTTGTVGNTVQGSLALPAGGRAIYTITGTASATGSAQNTATVTPTTPGCGTGTNQVNCGGGPADTPDLPIGSGIDLSLSKTNPPALAVGATSDYTLTVTNGGTGPAASATVVDHLPVNVRYERATGAQCVVAGDIATGQVLTCTLDGPIAAGARARFSVTVTPLPGAVGSAVRNLARVDTGGETDPGDPGDCLQSPAPAGCAVTDPLPVDAGIRLSLTKTGPATMAVGVEAQYVLTVKNEGTGATPSVTVIDLLPAGLGYVGATGADCSAAGQRLTCVSSQPLAAGASLPITITVLPLAAGTGLTVINRAAVDVHGGKDPVDPGTCTVTGTPAGCGVSPPSTIGSTAPTAIIQGNVFRDDNRNGHLEAGEPDISGVDVQLVGPGADGRIGTADDVVLRTVRTASPFTFTKVADGDYLVRVVEGASLAGLVPTSESDRTIEVTITGQRDRLHLEFGYAPPPVTPKPSLPTTGTQLAILLGLAMLLLGAGALMVAVTRRRTGRPAD